MTRTSLLRQTIYGDSKCLTIIFWKISHFTAEKAVGSTKRFYRKKNIDFNRVLERIAEFDCGLLRLKIKGFLN